MLFLIIAAAVFNAIMDEVSNGFFEKSVFSSLNPKWWDSTKSYPNKHVWWPKIPRRLMETLFVPFTDAWHCAKMLMLFSLSWAVVTYEVEYGLLYDALLRYAVFVFTFELFYSYILRRSPNANNGTDHFTVD